MQHTTVRFNGKRCINEGGAALKCNLLQLLLCDNVTTWRVQIGSLVPVDNCNLLQLANYIVCALNVDHSFAGNNVAA